MAFPAFFTQVPRIVLHDGLAELLGASDDGLMDYGYEDAVRLAGHSCPTVAGAWLMTTHALKALYPNSIPERGEIQVSFGEAADSGVTGVVANVASLITGATADTGFHGLAGQHDRRNLLFFNADIAGEIAFTRRDTGASVAVSYSARSIAPSPITMPLLQHILAGQATTDQKRELTAAWQDRVQRILKAGDEPGIITLTWQTAEQAQ
ncbi:MAG TPA: FmdE family protein [Castellaniella sp.]|uniref:FmdE family protein n=1 Tax=Castellaniella sp. TaxID=1955812 RepID=UPI002EEFF1D3